MTVALTDLRMLIQERIDFGRMPDTDMLLDWRTRIDRALGT